MDLPIKSKCTASDRQNPSSSGLINFDNLPRNCFHLGENVFVVISSFGEKHRIHLRKYTAYGKKCYPSKVGVTMSLTQWIEFVKNCEMMTRHLSYGIFRHTDFVSIENLRITVLNREHRVIFNKDITSKTGNAFKTNITISEVQWNELVRISTDVTNCMVDVLYRSISFETIFKSQFPNHEFPRKTQSLDYQEILSHELQHVIRKHITSYLNETCTVECKELSEVMYDGDAFNSAVLGLDLDKVAEDYAGRTILPKSNVLYENSEELINYIDENFLKSVKLNEMVNNIRKDLHHQLQDFD